MSKNIEINYKSDVGYEVLYPMVQTSSLLPGTLSGQFVFDTAPKSNVAASADDELLRLGEGRGEIESYWLERYPWKLETTIMSPGSYSYITPILERNLKDYYSVMLALDGDSLRDTTTVTAALGEEDGNVTIAEGYFVIVWVTSNNIINGVGFRETTLQARRSETKNYILKVACSTANRPIYVYTF